MQQLAAYLIIAAWVYLSNGGSNGSRHKPFFFLYYRKKIRTAKPGSDTPRFEHGLVHVETACVLVAAAAILLGDGCRVKVADGAERHLDLALAKRRFRVAHCAHSTPPCKIQ